MGKRHLVWLRSALIGLVVFLLAGGSLVWASEITNSVKATIDEVISIVKDESLKGQQDLRRERLRHAINKRFNYKQMVMRSLARNWQKLSPQEQKDFTGLFKKLLENSYASKIESYSDETINYVDEIVKGKYAMVKTEVVRKDATIGVDYKLVNDNGDWQVYDFVIEGVSMVRNYRTQFTKIIRKESYQALVEKLNEKIQELENNRGNPVSEEL